MNIKKLIVRIEEDNWSSKMKGFSPTVTKVNVVEYDKSTNTYKNKSRLFDGKWAKLGPKCGISI